MEDNKKLEYWLRYFGMPEENIENCMTQIAQDYGACRYLDGVSDGADAVNELSKEESVSEELAKAVKDVLKDKESAKKFLLSAGIMDADGKLAEPYRTEETLCEDFEREIHNQIMMLHLTPCYDDLDKFARHFANWQKQKILKESEDAIQYVKENHSPSEVSDFQNAMNIAVMKAFDAGKEKMREQIMRDATEVEVKVDAGGYSYIPQIELYDYNKDMPLAKEGDKYKVILIKED